MTWLSKTLGILCKTSRNKWNFFSRCEGVRIDLNWFTDNNHGDIELVHYWIQSMSMFLDLIGRVLANYISLQC